MAADAAEFRAFMSFKRMYNPVDLPSALYADSNGCVANEVVCSTNNYMIRLYSHTIATLHILHQRVQLRLNGVQHVFLGLDWSPTKSTRAIRTATSICTKESQLYQKKLEYEELICD